MIEFKPTGIIGEANVQCMVGQIYNTIHGQYVDITIHFNDYALVKGITSGIKSRYADYIVVSTPLWRIIEF